MENVKTELEMEAVISKAITRSLTELLGNRQFVSMVATEAARELFGGASRSVQNYEEGLIAKYVHFPTPDDRVYKDLKTGDIINLITKIEGEDVQISPIKMGKALTKLSTLPKRMIQGSAHYKVVNVGTKKQAVTAEAEATREDIKPTAFEETVKANRKAKKKAKKKKKKHGFGSGFDPNKKISKKEWAQIVKEETAFYNDERKAQWLKENSRKTWKPQRRY